MQMSLEGKASELEAAISELQTALAQQQESVNHTIALLDEKKGELFSLRRLSNPSYQDPNNKMSDCKEQDGAGARFSLQMLICQLRITCVTCSLKAIMLQCR